MNEVYATARKHFNEVLLRHCGPSTRHAMRDTCRELGIPDYIGWKIHEIDSYDMGPVIARKIIAAGIGVEYKGGRAKTFDSPRPVRESMKRI